VKKFVHAETVDKGQIDPQSLLPEKPVQPEQDQQDQLNPTPSPPAAVTPEAPSSPLPPVVPRLLHARQVPAWMKDYVCA